MMILIIVKIYSRITLPTPAILSELCARFGLKSFFHAVVNVFHIGTIQKTYADSQYFRILHERYTVRIHTCT